MTNENELIRRSDVLELLVSASDMRQKTLAAVAALPAVAAWNRRANLHDDTKAQLAKAMKALRAADSYLAKGHDKMAHNITRAVLAEIEKGGV